jgi:hypothetical protein
MPIGQNIDGLQRCVVHLLPEERLVFVAPVKQAPAAEYRARFTLFVLALFPETCGLDGSSSDNAESLSFRTAVAIHHWSL